MADRVTSAAKQMQYYDDRQNEKAAKIIFFVFQACIFLLVYGVVHTSFAALHIAAKKHNLTFMAYFPVVFVLIFYMGVIYKTVKIFQSQKKIDAVLWSLGWAGAGIAGLYFYLSALAGISS